MTATVFRELGVRVEGGAVWTNRLFKIDRKQLGLLAGAEAIVSADSGIKLGRAAFHTLLGGPAGLITGQRTAFSVVMLADGTMHEHKLEGKTRIQAARQEALRLNLLAKAAARAP